MEKSAKKMLDAYISSAKGMIASKIKRLVLCDSNCKPCPTYYRNW